MSDEPTRADQYERVINALWAYASSQSELGREFAWQRQMHPTDAAAIVAILRAEQQGTPLTPARLTERLGMTSGATSILLNRLEQAGHVIRTRGYTDRRRVTLHSTPAVHEAAAAFFSPLRAQLDALMAGCTPEQLSFVERFVSGFRDIVDQHTGAGERQSSQSSRAALKMRSTQD